MRFNVSDWVHGKTVDGEMVYGFVEEVDSVQGIVTLFVVQSDHEERVGRTADVRASTVRKVPDAKPGDSRHVPDLIDLALATRDEAWFRELTGGRGSDNPRISARSQGGTALRVAPVNRLSRFFG